MLRVTLVLTVLVAVTLAAPNDLLKRLEELLNEKKMETKNIATEAMAIGPNSVTVQLVKNVAWDQEGNWKLKVEYWRDDEERSEAQAVSPGFQTWEEWSNVKCPIPDYPGAMQPACVKIEGLEPSTTYNVGTVIEIHSSQGVGVQPGTTQSFTTTASKKNSGDLKKLLMKALKDLLEE